MKHLNFFIVLVLLTVLATSLGFAGKESGVKAKLPGVTQTNQQLGSHPARQLQVLAEDGQAIPAKSRTTKVLISKEQYSPTLKMQDIALTSAMKTMGGLAGNFDIPGLYPFNTLENAVIVLNNVGTASDVTFTLLDATYVVNPITFSYNGTNNVTIKPATGVAVTIQFVSTLTDGKGFAFNGAKNITIDGEADGITLEYSGTSVFPASDAFGATIYMTGATENITVKNTHIKGQVDNAVWANQTDGRPAIFFWNADDDPSWADGITFDGCTVTNATIGLKALCEGVNYSVSNLTVKNSFFGDAYGEPLVRAFIMEWAYSVTFENNVFDGLDYLLTYFDYGTMTEYDLSAFYAAYSHLYDGYYNSMLGLDGTVLKHNIFQNFQSTGASGNGYYAMGIRSYGYNLGLGTYIIWENNKFMGGWMTNNRVAIIYGEGSTKLYHNTFRITGTQTYSGQNRRCVYNGGTSYNNVVSNEATSFAGPPSSALHCFFPVGTNNNNAVYAPNGVPFNSLSEVGAVAAGYNINGVWGNPSLDADLNITTGPSSAENIGRQWLPVVTDFAGATVDTSALGTRDAGVYQFSTGVAIGVDVFPSNFTIPPAGIPVGPPQIPTVRVKNNSADTTDAFNLIVKQTAGAGAYLDTVLVTLLPMESKLVTFDAWNPPSAGGYTFSATTELTGDIKIGNDIITTSTTASNPILISAPKTYTWDVSNEGWTGTNDFKLKSGFTKLGGPKSGQSWVTERPTLASTYTEGANAAVQGYAANYPGPNLVTSPWLDISGLTGSTLYISLDHSLKTEPGWDICWLRYTTDGITWRHLGKLNDPKGVNIYNESVYEYADVIPDAIDKATMIQYGLITDPLAHIATWSSNGGATATGPYGWVYAQLRINTGDYTPEIVGSTAIRFQYLTFSDALGTEDPGGWAVDNFTITNTAPTFTGNTITGTAYHDQNGNGQFDVEPVVPNVDVFLTYFSVPLDTEKTDGNGVYTFLPPSLGGRVNLPGSYQVRFDKPGYAWTEPAVMSGIANVNCPSDGSTKTQNLGYFEGYVTGIKFNDLYDDSLYTPILDPPLQGWTIEVHKDSANGPLIGTAISGVNGIYKVPLPPYYWGGTNPGNYVVKEVARPTIGRQTYPWNPSKNYTITITGTSGGLSAGVTDINFGNFVFGTILCEVVQDRNGNGVRDLSDYPALLPGVPRVYIDVFKNQVKIGTDTLSDGVSSHLYRSLEMGTYGFKRVNAIPTGHVETAPASTNPPSPTDLLDSITVIIDRCGIVDSASFLYFNLISVSGMKFEDKDNSGSLNAGDVGADGWTINISGSVYGSASAVTAGGGNYTITNVGPGLHTVSETILSSDWQQTYAPPSSPPTLPNVNPFTAITASQGGDRVNMNFGNFKEFCVAGIKFHDSDMDGVQDEGEEPLAGWTISLTHQDSIVTGVDGKFEWCGLPRGSYTLSETPQVGWVASTPPGGTITFNGISGDTIVIPFGNSGPVENTKYRTFTYEQLRDCSIPANNQKVLKAPKMTAPAKAPWYAIPMMTLVNQLVAPLTKGGEAAVLLVGERNKVYPWGKIAPWLEPASYSDVSKTLVANCGKVSLAWHTGAPQPFNITGTSVMAKRYKSIPPGTKNNNKLDAELLTLQVNLALSDKGHTTTGLGAIIYPTPGPWGSNIAIDSVEAYANKIMTNWYTGMVTPSPANPADYDALYTAVRGINLAFASTSVVDTTPDGGWRAPKFKYVGIKNAIEVGFLLPTAAPKARPVGTPEVIPDVYALGQNYPNPFNPTTTLSFELPSDAVVTLKIYNLLGQEVATVLDRQEYSAGTYEESFDASQLASGVYLYRVVVEQIGDDGSTGQSFTQVKKMVLIK